MPKIRRIQIKNLRSIHNLDIDVKDLSVFVGDNDCGKSNILRALNLFFNGKTNPNQDFDFRTDYNRYVEPIANKAPQIEVTLDLELPDSYHRNNGQFVRWTKTWRATGAHKDDYYGFNYVPKRRGGGFKTEFLEDGIPARSNVHTLLAKIEFEYVPAIRSTVFFKELRGRIYRVISQVAEEGMRETSGDFEAAVAGYVAGLITDITGQLGDDAKISMPNDLSNIFEQLDFLYTDKFISLDSRGDGIKARYIPLILKFIVEQKKALGVRGAPPHTFIWAYEEPENNLEFRRSQELADTFCSLAESEITQVILTTHSPVFYNLANADNEFRNVNHIVCPDGNTGTIIQDLSDIDNSLDTHMGVMPIIAPHILRAQKEVESLLTQQADLQKKLNELNPTNLPTVFVEGPTEYALLSNLLERFRPRLLEHIFLAQPPARAGANYVTNMLRSWEFKNRHLPNADRKKAYGILDTDDEGQSALERFNTDIPRPKFVSPKLHLTPIHLRSAFENGMLIPVCLETLWPPQIWREAFDDGWLREESIATRISSDLLRRLIEENEALNQVFDDEETLFLKYSPRDKIKTDWVEWMTNHDDNDLEPLSREFLRLFDDISYELGLTIPGVPLV